MIMFCWKQYAKISLDDPKIIILMSKQYSGAPKNLEELQALLHEDSYQTLAECAE